MIHRGLDANEDWVFGKGRNSYTRGLNAVMLNIKTRLLSFKFDCFFDMEANVDWFSTLNAKDYQNLLFQIRNTIINSYGVKAIKSVEFDLQRDRKFIVNYAIITADNLELQDSVEVFKNA